MTMDPHAGGELTDNALQNEIELVGDLVVAASAIERPLTDDEIDHALGIHRGHPVRVEKSSSTPHRSWRHQRV